MDFSRDKQGKFNTRRLGYGLNLKRETESLRIIIQNNVIWTNYVKDKIDNMKQNRKCRLCRDGDETINHISKCSKLAQNV